MTTNYSCRRCMFKTEKYSNILKHSIKQKNCKKNIESYNYSEDQLLILTLLPNNNEYNDDILEHLKDSDVIYKNKDKLLSAIDYIDKHKIKQCLYCNEEFKKYVDLRNHVLISCFHKEITKNNIEESKVTINNISNNNNNNSNNSSNTTNNNITNNIYIDLKSPIPFDEDWDISQIAENTKTSLLISKIMYTGLLEEILKNELNLNIIIDKNNDSGMVYKNDIDQYIQMKSKDIIDNTMRKLQKHLLDINDTNTTSIEEFLKDSKKIIIKKHSDYIRSNDTQKIVKEFVSKIYENKKDDAIKMSQKIINKKTEQQGF